MPRNIRIPPESGVASRPSAPCRLTTAGFASSSHVARHRGVLAARHSALHVLPSFPMLRRQLGISPECISVRIELIDPVRLGGQEDGVTVGGVDIAVGAHSESSGFFRADMQERIRP